ncbi:MAG: hypothetical protein Q9179_003108 [Wetmoreana sp. 5 TL-2023]
MKGKSSVQHDNSSSDVSSAILQRVASASVTVDAQLVSSIGRGVLVFAAVAPDDTPKEVESMAVKVLKLKMWPDEAGGTWKRSVQDIKGEVLCVSQFTLLASTKKGSKPDFHGAAGGEQARELYDHFVMRVQELYEHEKVKNGVFAAMMQGIIETDKLFMTVNLQNDGPVSIDYQSHDAEVIVTISLPCLLPETVTLEIQTNPAKEQGKTEAGPETKSKGKTEYEIPPELLE